MKWQKNVMTKHQKQKERKHSESFEFVDFQPANEIFGHLIRTFNHKINRKEEE